MVWSNDLEVVLLEMSGSYENKYILKACLLWWKPFPTDTVLFLRQVIPKTWITDKYLCLWSIKYISNNLYVFDREDKITISEDPTELDNMLSPLLDFFFFYERLCNLDLGIETVLFFFNINRESVVFSLFYHIDFLFGKFYLLYCDSIPLYLLSSWCKCFWKFSSTRSKLAFIYDVKKNK
jgi:hypothetical protein